MLDKDGMAWLTEAKAHFVAAFRENPPFLRRDYAWLRLLNSNEWKAEMRAYNAPKLELNLATSAGNFSSKHCAFELQRAAPGSFVMQAMFDSLASMLCGR